MKLYSVASQRPAAASQKHMGFHVGIKKQGGEKSTPPPPQKKGWGRERGEIKRGERKRKGEQEEAAKSKQSQIVEAERLGGRKGERKPFGGAGGGRGKLLEKFFLSLSTAGFLPLSPCLSGALARSPSPLSGDFLEL